MSYWEKISIKAPDDPEIRMNVRDTLDYYITFPTGYDEAKQYGLVFCIAGYGDIADSEYQLKKLSPYIADKYNLVVVGVRYHNDVRIGSMLNINLPLICDWYGLERHTFDNLSGDEILDILFDTIVSKKVFSLDPRLALKQEAFHKYSSFGFMPAIDHLVVLFDVLQRYNIDKRDIIAFGSSYGGYIAMLMAKYAPHTFSLVIDNCGFCNAQLQEILGGQIDGISGSYARYFHGRRYEVPFCTNTLWSTNEFSDYYFSDAHKSIRNLINREHRTPSSTVYCCYHTVKDEIVPISYKDKLCELLKEYNTTVYKRVDNSDIDGLLFKTLKHGMNASLRKMFDVSVENYIRTGVEKEGITDFDRDVTYGFPCADKLYNFTFSSEGLSVEVNDRYSE